MSRTSKQRTRKQIGKASKPGIVRKAMHNRQALFCGLRMHDGRGDNILVPLDGVPTIAADIHAIFSSRGDLVELTPEQEAAYVAQVEAGRDELRRRKIEKRKTMEGSHVATYF